jgi:hypothetical protein
VEIVTKAGTEVRKEIEIETGAKEERETEVKREGREGTARKGEEPQEIRALVKVMTEENAIQGVESEIRRLEMELESRWQLLNLR